MTSDVEVLAAELPGDSAMLRVAAEFQALAASLEAMTATVVRAAQQMVKQFAEATRPLMSAVRSVTQAIQNSVDQLRRQRARIEFQEGARLVRLRRRDVANLAGARLVALRLRRIRQFRPPVRTVLRLALPNGPNVVVATRFCTAGHAVPT